MKIYSLVLVFVFAQFVIYPKTNVDNVILNDISALKKALKQSKPGDVFVMADGIWKDAEIKFEGQGTVEKPITLRAQTPGKVFLTGHSSVRLGGSYLVLDGLHFKDGSMPNGHVISFRANEARPAKNSRVTNCAIIGYNPPSRDEESFWISLYGVSNRVDHCLLKGKNDGSPNLTVWLEGEPNYHLIDHNHFADRPPLGRNGGETMRIGDSKTSMQNSRTIVEFNYFEDCNGEAEYISNKSCENIYRHNTFMKCKGALVLRHGNRCVIEGNYFFGNNVEGTGGVRLIGEDHKIFNNYFQELAGKEFESTLPFVNGIPNSKPNEYFRIKNAVVAFNTLVDCYQNLTFGIGVGARNRVEPPMNCTIANNLVVAKHGPVVLFQDQPIDTKWMGNIFCGTEPGVKEGVSVLDPKLKRDADGLWRLAKDSPAVGAAKGEFPVVTSDIDGQVRNGKKDVGCDQVSDNTKTMHPLKIRDVGPSWIPKI